MPDENEEGNRERRGRRPHPTELVKHTILVPATLWAWARSKPGGAGGLIRALLTQAQKEDEEPDVWPMGYPFEARRQLSVPTPGGAIVVTPDEKGVTVTFEGEHVLQYTYDNRRKCPVIVIPTRPIERQSSDPLSGDDFSSLGLEEDE